MSLLESRHILKPFKYPWAYDAWLRHEQMHWLFQEVPMLEDVTDWKFRLKKEEKNFLTNIFRFFTLSDMDVAGAYVSNYLPYFKQPEVRMMLLGFAAREALHIAAYNHLIETLDMPDSIHKEFMDYKEMKEKHEYLLERQSKRNGKYSVALDIATFSGFIEGLQLFSSFIMLLNFTRYGKMKGMGKIISWSILDEELHVHSMIQLFREFIHENPELWNNTLKKQIYSVAEKLVEMEDNFIDLCYNTGSIEGLEREDIKQYIRYIADRRLLSLGLKNIFKVKDNPLPWVDGMLYAVKHTNFFENTETAYTKGAITGTWEDVWAK